MSNSDVRTTRTRGSGKPRKKAERTAFITAPANTDTSVIRQLLQRQGVNAFALHEVDLPGAALSMIVKEAIERADIVIAVLGGKEESGNVLFELGVAQALQKPTLIIAAKEETISLLAATGIPYLRAKPDNLGRLEFGLAQFLAAPRRGNASPKPTHKETRPLGQTADDLLARLHADQEHPESLRGEMLLQDLIVKALRASGIPTVSVGQKQGNASIDIAVWSNDLEPWVRNPLLIEVKKSLPGKGELDALVKRFANAFRPGSVDWALVIYGHTAAKVGDRLKALHPHILLLSAEDFLTSLRDTAFGDLIRKLVRN